MSRIERETQSDESRKRRRGQSLTELAIGFPMLCLILLSTLDLGQMFFTYIELRNGVREGASYGARNPDDIDGITYRVSNHACSAGHEGDKSCVEFKDSTAVSVSHTGAYNTVLSDATITVTGSRTFEPITLSFLVRFGIPGSIDLVSSAKAKVLT